VTFAVEKKISYSHAAYHSNRRHQSQLLSGQQFFPVREALIYSEPVECLSHKSAMKQTIFASLAFDRKKKQTRRERFLAEMDACRGRHCSV
jgi:hypothetical protein